MVEGDVLIEPLATVEIGIRRGPRARNEDTERIVLVGIGNSSS